MFAYLAKPAQAQTYLGHETAHVITARNKMPKVKVVANEVSEGKKIASSISKYVSNGLISAKSAEEAISLNGDERYRALYRLAFEGVRAKKESFKGHQYEAHISKRASLPTKTALEVQGDKIALGYDRKCRKVQQEESWMFFFQRGFLRIFFRIIKPVLPLFARSMREFRDTLM